MNEGYLQEYAEGLINEAVVKFRSRGYLYVNETEELLGLFSYKDITRLLKTWKLAEKN